MAEEALAEAEAVAAGERPAAAEAEAEKTAWWAPARVMVVAVLCGTP